MNALRELSNWIWARLRKMARRKATTDDIAHIFRVRLVGRMEKWEDKK